MTKGNFPGPLQKSREEGPGGGIKLNIYKREGGLYRGLTMRGEGC